MDLLLKQITGAYGAAYGADADSSDAAQAHKLELDPIEVTPANMGRLHAEARTKFGQQALSWIQGDKVFVTLLRDCKLPRDVSKVIAIKWESHLSALEKYTVIAETQPYGILFSSGYFAVRKAMSDVSRAIFNGARLNSYFKPPPPVNLLPIDRLLHEAADIVARTGKPHVFVSDIRHCFHQYRVDEVQSKTFGLRMEDGRWFRWLGLPMGWSYSPRIAQCLAWEVLLRPCGATAQDLGLRSEDLARILEGENPPSFLGLYKGDVRVGLVTVLYDNLFILSTERRLVERWQTQWATNAKHFGVTLKVMKMTDECNVRSPRFTPVEHFGLQFGAQKCITAPSGWQLVWRHAPEKIEKWKALLHVLRNRTALAAREVARVIGVIMWDQVISLAPLCRVAEPLEVLRRVAKWVGGKKRRWQETCPVSEAEFVSLEAHLMRALSNTWYMEFYTTTEEVVYGASDASDEALGGVLFDEAGSVLSHDWFSEPCTNDETIFLRELRALELLVRRVLLTRKKASEIVCAVDNTAAVHCIRRGYSNSKEGLEIIRRIIAYLEDATVRLRVVSVRGVDNIADLPSHRRAPTEDARIKATWRTITSYLAGHGKETSSDEVYVDANFMNRVRHSDGEDFMTPMVEAAFVCHDDALEEDPCSM
jgi:hypothetical protein